MDDPNLSRSDLASAGHREGEPAEVEGQAPDNGGTTASPAGIPAPPLRAATTEGAEVLSEEEQGVRGALIPEEDGVSYQQRWQEIQIRFVDEPRQSVEQADTLVAQVIQQLADSFARERSSLEEQWEEGQDVSTEDLRVALQRYRLFFERLLAA